MHSVILKYCVLSHPTVMTLLNRLLLGPSVQWTCGVEYYTSLSL